MDRDSLRRGSESKSLAQSFQHCFADAGSAHRVLAGDEVAVDNHVLGHRDCGGGVLASLFVQFVLEAERDLVGAGAHETRHGVHQAEAVDEVLDVDGVDTAAHSVLLVGKRGVRRLRG